MTTSPFAEFLEDATDTCTEEIKAANLPKEKDPQDPDMKDDKAKDLATITEIDEVEEIVDARKQLSEDEALLKVRH